MTAEVESRGTGARTLELLRCIALGEREFALKELAERAGLAPSTVRRDLIERAGPKAYRVGPELFRLASLIVQKFDLHRIARPFLEALWKAWQETASFCLYEPSMHRATVAESIASPHPLKFELAPYSEISLAWGSLGRSILAQLPSEELETVLARSQRSPLSGRPPPPRRALREELRLIRERGYSLYEDDAMNIAGVSAPVFTSGGAVVGCIGVTMPAARFHKTVREKLPASVLHNARELSSALGSS
jgi:DNA-binding IclR family transcriptional regulator